MTLLLPVALICKTSNIVIRRRNHIFCGSFCFAWEQRKLSKCLEVSDEKNTENIYGIEDVLSVSGDYGVVNQIEFQGRSFAGASVANYGVVHTGNVVYTKSPLKSNPYGIIKTNKGKTGIVSVLYGVYRVTGDICPELIQTYFEQDARLNNYLRPLVNKGAKNTLLISDDDALQGVVVLPPSYAEQLKMKRLFDSIDNLITLHQREDFAINYRIFSIDATQKMAITWEQRELNSLCDKFTDGDWIEAKDQSDCGVRLIQTGNVGVASYIDKPQTAKWISKDTFERLHCEEIFAGDILISRLPEPAGRACIVPKSATKMITAVDCTIVRTKAECSNEFLVQYLSSQKYFNEVNACLAGGTRQRISRGNLSKFLVPIPKDFTEQCLIGQYFSGIDNLITLHQCEDFIELKSLHKRIVTYTNKDLTDTWEQRKFKDLVQIERGGSPRPIDDYITDAPDGLNWVKIGDAPLQGNYITHTAEKIKPSGLSKTREVHSGDLILSNSMSFGKPYIMAIDGCIHDGWLLIRDVDNCFDLKFLCQLLGTVQMLEQYKSFAAGSTVNNLNKELVGNTMVTLPSKEEQALLGTMFTCIDNLITLHQRKYPLKSKTTLLDFNKQTFRFFANTWEQRKLGDAVQINMGQSPVGSTYSDVPSDYILVQGNADLKDGWVFPRVWTTQITKKADAGDLIMSVRAPAGAMGKTAYEVVIGRGVAAIKGNEFVYQLLVKMDADGFWKVLSCGSTFESLNSDNIKSAEVVVPQSAEQEVIGRFFEKIDNLITLHQREEFGDFKRIFSFSSNYFASFKTTTWEQRKLGNCFDERQERSSEGELISVTINEGIKKFSDLGRHDNSSEDKSNYKVVRVGDIAYNSMRMWQGASGYSPFNGILSPAYTVLIPKPGVDASFFSYVFKRPDIIHTFQICSQGITSDTWNLKFPALAEIEISMPTITEQMKIAESFRSLDNLITLHQRDILYKKGVLQWQNKLKKQNFSANILNAGLKCIRKEPCARSP